MDKPKYTIQIKQVGNSDQYKGRLVIPGKVSCDAFGSYLDVRGHLEEILASYLEKPKLKREVGFDANP
jgi:hypothetical protein